MNYTIFQIAKLIDATILQQNSDVLIENIITDSRKLLLPANTLFFALPGNGRNGNSFIESLYSKGVYCFVVDKSIDTNIIGTCKNATFLHVVDVLAALQTVAAYHRQQFNYTVIGITGSNGKTIVKEWLNQLLTDEENIVRSPKSYNSQIGVPLSIWRMRAENTLGIFESGISQKGEMQLLQKMIDPQIGIVTFIGSAHAEGFTNTDEKIAEKLLLFTNSKHIIFCADDAKLLQAVQFFVATKNTVLKTFIWGQNIGNDVQIISIQKSNKQSSITFIYKNETHHFTIPFTDAAYVNNAITCLCTLLVLQKPMLFIINKIKTLRPIAMRLELKQGINNCSIINDGYSADMQSLSISLDFLAQQNQHSKRTVILSDILQTGKDGAALYAKIAAILATKNIHRFIGIGNEISANKNAFSSFTKKYFYQSTSDFIADIHNYNFADEVILLKGARVFEFEKISHLLEEKLHETRLEINLNALRHNLLIYKKLLKPNVGIMAMVKAFSYGSGSFEVANVLQHAGVKYLAVAYTDEGVELRKAGITLPIMVMNAEATGFESIVKYNLEPEVFSLTILHSFKTFIQQKNKTHYPIHIKIDTGMHRLGFEANQIPDLCTALIADNAVKVVSVFSHLAASDAANFNDFTTNQSALFIAIATQIQSNIGYTFLQHISNSAAIFRHPQLQLNMVRLGIGLYGVDATAQVQQALQPVAVLKTTISQIKNVGIGDSVGYSRKGIVTQNSTIATVRIGYADGYPRLLSNGKGKMSINGNLAPVIGNVCMDMTMLDITGLDVSEGDEVIVFGDQPTVTNVAQWADTISYEILTNISQRVKRVYFEE